jgi:hypothetical protein
MGTRIAVDVLFVPDPLRGINDALLANIALFFCSRQLQVTIYRKKLPPPPLQHADSGAAGSRPIKSAPANIVWLEARYRC